MSWSRVYNSTRQRAVVQCLCVVLAVVFVGYCICVHFWRRVETFGCAGTYSHSSCPTNPNPNPTTATDQPDFVDSGELTHLVGNNKSCADTAMQKPEARMLDNGDIRRGERVYAKYKSPIGDDKFYPATVIRVYRADNTDNLPSSATKYKSTDSGIRESVLTRPNPLFYYLPDFSASAQLQNRLTVQDMRKHVDIPSTPMKTLGVHQLPPVTGDTVKVDVMFNNQPYNIARVQSAEQDLRLTVGTEVKRTPQSVLVDKCARECLSTYAKTWGVEVGSCLTKSCKCQCLVPDNTMSTCTNVVSVEPTDTNINDHTLVDLHQIDGAQSRQYTLHERLTQSCGSSHGWVQPHSKPKSCVRAGTLPSSSSMSGSSCSLAPCSQYNENTKEMELCMDTDKLKAFLDKTPTVTSMGEGAPCPSATGASNPAATCSQNTDIPCAKRADRNTCTARKGTDLYKCGWHEHNSNKVLDAYATGCYDEDKCVLLVEEDACDLHIKCSWDKTEGICTEKPYCPSMCKQQTTETDCKQLDTVCRWNGSKCKIKTLIDEGELRQISQPPATTTVHHILQDELPNVLFSDTPTTTITQNFENTVFSDFQLPTTE